METLSYKLLVTLSLLALISMAVPVRAQESSGVSGTTPMFDRGAVAPLPVPDLATEDELSVDENPSSEVREGDTLENEREDVEDLDSPPVEPTIIEPQAGAPEPQKTWWKFW